VELKVTPSEVSQGKIEPSNDEYIGMNIDEMGVDYKNEPVEVDSGPGSASCHVASIQYNPATSYIAACVEKMAGNPGDDLCPVIIKLLQATGFEQIATKIMSGLKLKVCLCSRRSSTDMAQLSIDISWLELHLNISQLLRTTLETMHGLGATIWLLTLHPRITVSPQEAHSNSSIE
jgi:hypothetical protein